MILIRLLIFVGSIVFSLMYFSVRWGMFGSLPSRSELKAIESFSSSEIYASGGELLGKFFIFDHSHVFLEEISPNLLNALLATEDIRFYKHQGTDYRSLMRVVVKNLILRQKNAGGGSTITHQLAKNLFPRTDGGMFALLIDKIQEAIIAGRMERTYTKEEILILYLNTVSFGENVFGIGSASQRFFNKKPLELNVQEAATLVGMLKASNTFNPRLFPERSVSRRNTVIDQCGGLFLNR